MILLPTAGLSLFASIPSVNAIQAVYCEALTSRVFAIANDQLYEIYSSGGVSASYGPLALGAPYSFASNNAGHLCIAANGNGYLFNLNTNVLAPILSFSGATGFNGSTQFGSFKSAGSTTRRVGAPWIMASPTAHPTI
jgi:hypothetical protein